MKKLFVIGALSAIAFCIMASFNNVHAWPLIFPFFAGMAAMAINKSSDLQHNYGYI